jgi:hypothetical protein
MNSAWNKKFQKQSRIDHKKLLGPYKVLSVEINQGKTKYKCISQNDNDDSSLQIESYLFEKIASYIYLG